MTALSRRRFLGLGSPEPVRRPQSEAAPRSFLEDFYAKRGRQAEVPLVFHPTVAAQDGAASSEQGEGDDRE